MANDQRSADIGKERSTSAPRSAAVKDIPTIVLDERKDSAPTTALISAGGGADSGSPHRAGDGNKRETGLSQSQTTNLVAHMPVRSSSDVGLPAASMPNLTLSQIGGEAGAHENHLEVFCSPRTFRRSVDLEINSKDHGRGQYEWVDSLESSSNCLKVLTASSRVGSSLSLNSECTARSIGLLSNDSDSDNDLSLSEAENNSAKQSQLRRFMSYPEEGAGPELCTRSSQSLINLKTADDKVNAFGANLSSATSETVSSEEDKVSLDKISLHQQTKSVKTSKQDNITPCSTSNDRLVHKARCAHKEGLSRESVGSTGSRNTHMLSYRCDANDSTRDLRIRQWLQDMDTNSTQ